MFGQPCVGCGHCCSISVCVFGQSMRDIEADDLPCPLLRYDGERHWCTLVEEEQDEDLEEGLAIAEGCCSGLNTWRQDIIDRTK